MNGLAGASSSMFELTGVSKRYGGHAAVDSVDLCIGQSQIVVLIGPSGCGKSTLLRLMVGLITADAGRVVFEQESITTDNVQALRHRMGYVIQDGGLFPHLTARQNITLLARHLNWNDPRIKERIETLADLTSFPLAALSRYPLEMSGGQRQRVSLMRALMLDPDVLLLDEPLGALDPMIRSQLQNDLRNIFRRLGKTVVMVTHDLAEAAYLADTIVLLHEGRIVQQGDLSSLIDSPANDFVTHFINAQRGSSILQGGAL